MTVRLPLLIWLLAVAPALAQPAPAIQRIPLVPLGPTQPVVPPGPTQPVAPPGPTGVPAAPPANVWLPRQAAELKALDKVSTRVADLTVRVGQSVGFGSLTIAVRACVVRPPDQAADAAAWLDITDSHPDAAQFHGWLVLSAPMVSMLQHPVYDVRLSGCR
jgi:hypothetical protein